MVDTDHQRTGTALCSILEEWAIEAYIQPTKLLNKKEERQEALDASPPINKILDTVDNAVSELYKEGVLSRMFDRFFSTYKAKPCLMQDASTLVLEDGAAPMGRDRDRITQWDAVLEQQPPPVVASSTTEQMVYPLHSFPSWNSKSPAPVISGSSIRFTTQIGHINDGFTDISFWMAEKPKTHQSFHRHFVQCFIVDEIVGREAVQRTVLYSAKRLQCLQLLTPFRIVRGWVCQCNRGLEALLIQIVAVELYACALRESPLISPMKNNEKILEAVSNNQTRMEGIIGILPIKHIPISEYKMGKSTGRSDRFIPVGTHVRAMVAPIDALDGLSNSAYCNKYIVLTFETEDVYTTCHTVATPTPTVGYTTIGEKRRGTHSDGFQPNLEKHPQAPELMKSLGFVSSLRNDAMHLQCTPFDFECSPIFKTKENALYHTLLNKRLLHIIESDPKFTNSMSFNTKLKFLDLEYIGHKYATFVDAPWKSKDTFSSVGMELTQKQSLAWADERVAEGVKFGRTKRFEMAIEYYNAALLLCTDHVDALVARGAAFANQLKFEDALKDFDKALQLDPHQKNAQLYRQTIVERMHEYKKQTDSKVVQRNVENFDEKKMEHYKNRDSMNAAVLQDLAVSQNYHPTRLSDSNKLKSYDLVFPSIREGKKRVRKLKSYSSSETSSSEVNERHKRRGKKHKSDSKHHRTSSTSIRSAESTRRDALRRRYKHKKHSRKK